MKKLEIPENVIVGGSLSGWWNERLDHMWINQAFKENEELLEKTVLIRD